ncbi:lipase member H-B isoform X2 [Agrilus planipennis]|uniref:Lipase member H-B isoform X2 n=1 Tax=Agrilus planipennis TaxID=224129 RepID=A0A1W4XVA0_AGRPL|nr:lipase member H-B isoform X2 [Agrilus planipennis]
MCLVVPAKLFVLLIVFEVCNGYNFNLEDIFGFVGGLKFNPAEYLKVNKRDIFFNLHTPNYPYPREIDEDNLDLVENDKPVKILLHGWVGNENVRTYQNITREYMKKGNYNIIHVDWRNVAVLPYAVASVCSKDVAKVISSFLLNLNEKKRIPMHQFHLIGISLGAHVAGLAGKQIKEKLNTQIGRITALDPAGPLFEFPPAKESEKLTKYDAKVVDVIHTDGGIVGALKPLGTIDFYPDGGIRPQEGCPLIPVEKDVGDSFFCGHYKAVEYFIRSINSKEFVGVQCKSWLKFKLGHCKGNKDNIMGENLIPERQGSFYLH